MRHSFHGYDSWKTSPPDSSGEWELPDTPDVHALELAYENDNEFHQCESEGCVCFLSHTPDEVEGELDHDDAYFYFKFDCSWCRETTTYTVKADARVVEYESVDPRLL